MKIEKLRNPYVRGNEGCSVSMIDLLEKINEIIDAMNGGHDPADIYSEDGRLIAKKDESEDERIRKWLIDYFGSIKETVWIHRDITCEQILGWLEKQKEQKPAEWNKATINGEPISTENQSVDIPLVEWSEEDEKMLSDLRNTLGCLMNAGAITFKTKKKFSNWLKSLRPQPKTEWSEEDNLMLTAVIQTLENFGPYGTIGMQIDWLKSLRPSWKPSEEQMEALNYAIAEWDGGKRLTGLYALRNDLKKLI